MSERDKLYGLARGKRHGIVFLYTRTSMRLFYAVKILLLITLSPIWFPLYALMWVGIWAEQALDWLAPVLEKVVVAIVPRKL